MAFLDWREMGEDFHGPVLGRRRLSAALRHARDGLGFTQEQVAAAMDWSLSKLIRIEKGAVGISTNDLKSLLRHYGVTDPSEVNDLVRLAKLARAKPWWAPFRDRLPSPDFEKLLGLEAEASLVEIFRPLLVPGLLQTEAYLEWVMNGVAQTLTTSETAHVRADVRLRRQQAVLESEHPPELRVVLDEGVLRRVADGPVVMHDQLTHLVDLGKRPNISITVIPLSTGLYVECGAFAVLSFPGPADPSVVYLENAWYDVIVDREEQVEKYRHLFSALRDRALDADESAALIERVAGEFA